MNNDDIVEEIAFQTIVRNKFISYGIIGLTTLFFAFLLLYTNDDLIHFYTVYKLRYVILGAGFGITFTSFAIVYVVCGKIDKLYSLLK